jgi:regulation of enolase protein 1 (concanavalin A-like superfamily)
MTAAAALLTPAWQIASGAQVPSSFTSPFTITALPKTDIWRPSSDKNVFNAPRIYQKFPLKNFQKISVTLFAPWKTQYDQGGVIINFPRRTAGSSGQGNHGENDDDDGGNETSQWIKASIEYHNSAPVLGVVGTDRLSDWSLLPMSAEFHQKARFVVEWKPEEGKVLVLAGQVGNGDHGVEGQGDGDGLVLLREICWVNGGGGGEDSERGEGERMVEVGVYAAKPTQDVRRDFSSFLFLFSSSLSFCCLVSFLCNSFLSGRSGLELMGVEAE